MNFLRNYDIETGSNRDGVAYAVAADLSRAIGYTALPSMLRLVDPEFRFKLKRDTISGPQTVWALSTAGVVQAVFRSTKNCSDLRAELIECLAGKPRSQFGSW